ncbi:MAG: hypothetical protein HQ556_06975 [Candidatus Marinimicrobia bacterium]|nr:hypothetical protein [Candidatus Neomarinimicrobiota bacterium]
MIYKDLSFQIVGLAMEVHKQLGYGFLEKVNENANRILSRKNGIRVRTKEVFVLIVYY